VAVDVFSVTSWSELAREGATNASPFIARQLASSGGPIIAATDYVRAVPESVRAYLPEGRKYVTLGTDGFGRSDTRAALRAYFGVDAASIVQAALTLLARS
jgi:pyruvate dehydrogenase E1 component